MDALVMCGGEGTRLGSDREKPLVPIAGRPMVDRVLEALAESRVERVFGVVSPATPETAAHLECPLVRTPGEGYVPDLRRALADDRVSRPVATVAADLPLLDGSALDAVLESGGGLSVVVPAGRKLALGLSADRVLRVGGRLLAPAGVNVVGDERRRLLRTDPRYAVNVNRPSDARVARWLSATGGE